MKSHLIPRFLADKALDQSARIEFGAGGMPRLTHNSWMDQAIVTRQGEDRLRDIDTAAASELRRLGLIWRFFPMTEDAKRQPIGFENSELITISDCDTRCLQIFALSLLWRAAVSNHYAFGEITLAADELERLRAMVSGQAEASPSDWPAVLVLLTNQGQPQVHAPLAQTIQMRAIGLDYPDVPIFRFFLDGLVVHIGRKCDDHELEKAWGKRILGASNDLIIIGRPYEGSFQQTNLIELQHELETMWPEKADGIFRTLDRLRSSSALPSE